MSRNIVIAFSGWKRSGKDTACDFIEDFIAEDFKYASQVSSVNRMSFATPIRQVIYDVFGIKDTDVKDKEEPINFLKKYFNSNKGTHVVPSYRQLLITIGEGMKKISCNSVWSYVLENKIKTAFKTSDNGGDNVFIIPDVRYKNELNMLNRLKKSGVEVYHYCVFRKETLPDWITCGLMPTNDEDLKIINDNFNVDASEIEWCIENPVFTSRLINDGTTQEFKEVVHSVVMDKIWK